MHVSPGWAERSVGTHWELSSAGDDIALPAFGVE